MDSMVIGNGESRKNFNLKNYSKDYTLIGCNAIHRDLEVQHLVCCDRRMVEEAVSGSNTLNTKIYARPDWFKYYRKIQKDKRIHLVPDLPYKGNLKQDDPVHWGSGTYAVLLAATLSKNVFVIGFDLYPVNEKVNNIYKGTAHYKDSKSQAVDPAYWIYQIGKVFEHFPSTNFIVLNSPIWEMPRSWKHPNVSFKILESKNLTLA